MHGKYIIGANIGDKLAISQVPNTSTMHRLSKYIYMERNTVNNII